MDRIRSAMASHVGICYRSVRVEVNEKLVKLGRFTIALWVTIVAVLSVVYIGAIKTAMINLAYNYHDNINPFRGAPELPPLFAYDHTPEAPKEQPKPDISMRLVYPNSIAYQLLNRSNVLIRTPRWAPLIWNLDNGDRNPLRIATQSADFIRAHEALRPWSLVAPDNVTPAKEGDHLFGFISVSCPTCRRTKAY